MEKKSQYSQQFLNNPANKNNTHSVNRVRNNQPKMPNFSLLDYYRMGRYGPLFSTPQELADLSLPVYQWLKKHPNKTQWDYYKAKSKIDEHKGNWLQRALVPRSVRNFMQTMQTNQPWRAR